MLLKLVVAAVVAAPLYELPDAEICLYLNGLSRTTEGFAERLAQVGRDTLGTPYEDGPLGEGPNGRYDQDPLMDLGRVDCVTYVEQCVALASAASQAEAFQLLQQIRYARGKIDYEARKHFFVADWIRAHPWCRDVSAELGVPAVELTRTISRRDFFKRVDAPGLGQNTPDRDVTIQYVPVAHAEAAERQLTAPALVVFVGEVDWLFALHCGLYLPDASGEGKLFHASSKHGKVVAVDLAEYVKEQSGRYLGFTAYRLEAPEGAEPVVGDVATRP